jgi:hypothetical protein
MEFRCPDCRTRRKDFKLFTQHLRTSGHKVCICGGYPYKHRPGSPYCHKNPLSLIREAWRRDEPPEVILEIAAHIVSESPDLAAQVMNLCDFLNVKEAA